MSYADNPSYPGEGYDDAWRALVFPRDYRQPEPRGRYHLVVIGAGPAGLVTAMAAAGLGAKVALVEKTAMGGDCLNVGCVPSKALLEFTRAGVGAEDFDDAFEWLRRVRSRIARHDSVQRFVDAGVDVFLGSAKFLDQDAVQVGHARLATRRTVIATGSHPALPPIEGLTESRPHTNATVFDLKRRPKRLGILGAGPVGCELAQAFARLDVEVILIETAPEVLPHESAQASAAVGRALSEQGVELRKGATVERVMRRGANVYIELRGDAARGDPTTGGEAAGGDAGAADRDVIHAGGGGSDEIIVDELLVATGRNANTNELNLAAVGVETDAAGAVVVDRHLRTTNPRVYAAGDVCSALKLTHNADAHARIVVQNALFAPTATTDKLLIPQCVYTDPEVARIGRGRETLEREGTAFDVYRVAFGELDRGQTQNDEDGFAEVLTARGGDTILGATLVGRDAGEQIASLCIAMTHKLGLAALGKTVLPYPTRAEYLRRLGDDYHRTRLTPLARRVLQTWLRLRA